MPAPTRLDLLTNRSHSAQSSRPTSAVMNLRGSRPNSAAIAQEIEGFEDDFMVCVGGSAAVLRPIDGCPLTGGGDVVVGDPCNPDLACHDTPTSQERVDEEEVIEDEFSEEEQDLGPTVEELIDRAQQEQMRLQEGNEGLQKWVLPGSLRGCLKG